MARRIAIAALVSLVFSTPTVRASELEDVASEAGVDARELEGAMSTTGLAARAYLIAVGELAAPAPPRDSIDRLLDCLAWHESRHTATAVNPRSGASGWLQFMPSTFRSTPPGRAGASIFNVQAQLAAGRWMIGQGRLHEWTTWRMCA